MVDDSGNTAAMVTLNAEGYATISAVMSFGPEQAVAKGTRVTLVELLAKEEERVIAVSETVEGGQVVFDEVRAGTYTLRPECGEFSLAKAAISKPRSIENEDSQVTRDTIEILTIQDQSGQTKALVELRPGEKASAKLEVKPTGKASFEDLSVDLVEIDAADNTSSDIRDTRKANQKGVVEFEDLSSGTLRVRFRCPITIQGYKMGGVGLADVLCPTTFLVP